MFDICDLFDSPHSSPATLGAVPIDTVADMVGMQRAFAVALVRTVEETGRGVSVEHPWMPKHLVPTAWVEAAEAGEDAEDIATIMTVAELGGFAIVRGGEWMPTDAAREVASQVEVLAPTAAASAMTERARSA